MSCHQVRVPALNLSFEFALPEPFLQASAKEPEEERQQKPSRWGPVPEHMQEEYKTVTAKKKKKRKSRWEQPAPGEEGAIIAKPMFPKELTLPGGVRVRRLTILFVCVRGEFV